MKEALGRLRHAIQVACLMDPVRVGQLCIAIDKLSQALDMDERDKRHTIKEAIRHIEASIAKG